MATNKGASRGGRTERRVWKGIGRVVQFLFIGSQLQDFILPEKLSLTSLVWVKL